MSNKPPLQGLPSFFQNAPSTLLEELADFELGGELEDNLVGEELEGVEIIGGELLETIPVEFQDDDADLANLDTFGDLGLKPPTSSIVGGGSLRAISLTDLINSSVNQAIDASQDQLAMDLVDSITAEKSRLPGQDPLTLAVNSLTADDNDVTTAVSGNEEERSANSYPSPYAAVHSNNSNTNLNHGAFPPGPPGAFPYPHGPPGHPGMPPMMFMPPPPFFNGPNGLMQPPAFFHGPPSQPLSYPAPVPQQMVAPVPVGPIVNQQRPKPLPRGRMMTPSDVKFVVGKTLLAVDPVDQYSEDYYYIQVSLKRQQSKIQKHMEELKDHAIDNSKPLPAPLPFVYQPPLPMWTETKQRILNQINQSKKSLYDKTKIWESKEQVLGHTQRSDASKPRAVLSVPTVWEPADDEEGGDDPSGGFKEMFASRLWSMRQAVQRGYSALGTVQELELLLQQPVIASNHLLRAEVVLHIQKALICLSQSLGIRGGQIESGLGFVETASAEGFSLDGALVAALLQTVKGKRLVSRSLNLLPPEQRWLLVPVIIARILQSQPNQQTPEEITIEKSLLKSILSFVQHAHEHQKRQQHSFDIDEECRQVQQLANEKGIQSIPHVDTFSMSGKSSTNGTTSAVIRSAAPFTVLLLGHLRQCVKSVMITYMEKKVLRQALLSCRQRAEMMHVIVELGNELSSIVDASIRLEWTTIKETFMAMLDG